MIFQLHCTSTILLDSPYNITKRSRFLTYKCQVWAKIIWSAGKQPEYIIILIIPLKTPVKDWLTFYYLQVLLSIN